MAHEGNEDIFDVLADGKRVFKGSETDCAILMQLLMEDPAAELYGSETLSTLAYIAKQHKGTHEVRMTRFGITESQLIRNPAQW